MKLLILFVLFLCVSGCLTSEQQTRLNTKMGKLDSVLKDLEKYKDMKDEVVDRFKTGELTVGEVTLLGKRIDGDIREAKETAIGIRDEIKALQGEGASGVDIATGILISLLNIAGALLGVRVWRGSVNNRLGDIGVTR